MQTQTPTIADRFILLLKDQITEEDQKSADFDTALQKHLKFWQPKPEIPRFGVWEYLGNVTNIPSQSWRSAYNRRQKPTLQMMEAVSRIWPQYAFWLMTGITDATNGHLAPDTALTFPERLYGGSSVHEQYFSKSLRLYEKLYEESGVDMDDDQQRMYALERTRPLGHWIASPLIKKAYEIAETEDYQELKEVWEKREQERPEDVKRITGESRPWLEGGLLNGLVIANNFGKDPYSKHQDYWDLFFEKEEVDKKDGNK